jgi:hypothetical protein
MRSILAIVALLSGLLVVACEDVQARRAGEGREKLVGTWLREIDAPIGKARRVLVLAPDGKFSEELIAHLSEGRTGRETRAGEWSYDGTNLKRRYTQEDGRQLSGNFNFATFELTKLTPSEFEGRNHAQGEEIRYKRVPAGTAP